MQRPSARQRGYNSRWQKARATFLANRPRCERVTNGTPCGALATVVHHKVPHKGDPALFWNTANWSPRCKLCHDSGEQGDEKRGFSTAVGMDGWPTDDRHPANRART